MSKEVIIDNEKYVKESNVNVEKIIYKGEKTIASTAIGKKAIVRSRNEGINIGIVILADETGVLLKNCRRIWYHKPKDSNLAWYEGVAKSGLSEDSKVSGTISEKYIIEQYSLTICNDDIYKSIMDKENVKS